MFEIQKFAQTEQSAKHRHVDAVFLLKRDPCSIDDGHGSADEVHLLFQIFRRFAGVHEHDAVLVNAADDVNRLG